MVRGRTVVWVSSRRNLDDSGRHGGTDGAIQMSYAVFKIWCKVRKYRCNK